MKRIINDITNKTFKSCYLLYGSERYLVTQYRARLRDAIITPDDTMNLNSFEGKGLDWTEIMSIGETMPFFSDHRVIMLDATGMFKSAGEQGKKLAEWVKSLPESTTLIFSEEDVDQRSALFKAVAEIGTACEMNGPSEDDLMRFVAKRLGSLGKKIRENDASYLLRTVGYDMQNLANEIEKLVAYTLGRDVVSSEDIDTVCVRQITGKIFDLTDAVAYGKKEAALHHYYTMLQLREKPAGILSMLTSHFNRLMLTKDLLMHGRNNRDVASVLGIKQYPADKYVSQCRGFSPEKLRRATELGVQLEKDFKSGNMDEAIAAEFYIISLLNM